MAHWRPDLLSLRLFLAVCEEASMTRAAERESIVPSAISKRIAEMEEATGVPLLVRGGRGVKPTAAGAALLHHAQLIVRTAEKMQAEMADYGKGVRGHVHLSANISSIVQFLPRDMSSFMIAHPHIRIDLQERVSPAIVEGVREGQIDIGICLASVGLSELEVHPYAVDRLAVVVHAAHPLARREFVRFEETLEYDFVALRPESGTTRMISALALRMGHSINHRMYVSTFEAASHIVAENLAIGILAVDAVRPFLGALCLKTVSLDEEWARREIVMVHRDLQTLAQPARALIAHLQQRVAARAGVGN